MKKRDRDADAMTKVVFQLAYVSIEQHNDINTRNACDEHVSQEHLKRSLANKPPSRIWG